VVVHTVPVAQPANQDAVIIANISDDTGIASTELSFRRGGETSFSTVDMVRSGDVYQGTIPSGQVTARGLEYSIFVRDIGGLTERAPRTGLFSLQIRVGEPGLVRDQAQPGGSEQTGYRLVSVPLDLDNKNPQAVLADDLGEYDITQWRFYEVPANQTKVEFPNTSPMSPGKSFWLIVRELGKRISTGAGTSTRLDEEFTITLNPQWNLIGNPFDFPIPLSKLTIANGQTVELRTYTGSWNDPVNAPVAVIQPFEGYALFNNAGVNTTLSINPDLAAPNAISLSKSPGESSELSWSISILARSQNASDGDNILGVDPRSKPARDDLDRPEPPVIGEFVSVYFPHPEWGQLNKNYCTDFRPEIDQGQIWELQVVTNIDDVVNLTFEGIETVSDEYDLWLFDPTTRVSQNLRQNRRYTAAASVAHPRRLQVLIGPNEFVHDELALTQTLPDEFELSQNFPNPFNPTTNHSIRFATRVSHNTAYLQYSR